MWRLTCSLGCLALLFCRQGFHAQRGGTATLTDLGRIQTSGIDHPRGT
jgi:hypothetical protein